MHELLQSVLDSSLSVEFKQGKLTRLDFYGNIVSLSIILSEIMENIIMNYPSCADSVEIACDYIKSEVLKSNL